MNKMSMGSTTVPWVVLALDNNEEVPYVVKLVNRKDYDTQFAIFKEIVGIKLAKEFSLKAPEFALIDFTEEFIEYALDEEKRLHLSNKHSGLKFATRYLDSSILYTHSLHRTYLKEYDFANLFAFDCLIYNMDRGRTPEKPNLLIHNDEFYVIDHEISMPFIDNAAALFNSMKSKLGIQELEVNYQQQLGYFYLKSLRADKKVHLFDEFEENLRNLDINTIEKTIAELTQLDIPTGHSHRLIEYLCILKKNPSSFCKALLKCLA